MEQLIKQIEQWAEDRNIIKGTRPTDQAMKLFSEFGELADAVGKNQTNLIKDGVGDVFVVLTIMCNQMNHCIGDHIGSYGGSVYSTKTAVSELATELAQIVSDCDDLKVDPEDNIAPIDMAVAHLDAIAIDIGSTLEECIQIAYNDIKDRKGVVYNGLFIKESNPAYKDALIKLGKVQ